MECNSRKVKPGYGYRCTIPGCENMYICGSPRNKHFCRIPSNNEVRRNKWLNILNTAFPNENFERKKKSHICEDHFQDKQFTSSLKNRLHRFALPDNLIPIATDECTTADVVKKIIDVEPLNTSPGIDIDMKKKQFAEHSYSLISKQNTAPFLKVENISKTATEDPQHTFAREEKRARPLEQKEIPAGQGSQLIQVIEKKELPQNTNVAELKNLIMEMKKDMMKEFQKLRDETQRREEAWNKEKEQLEKKLVDFESRLEVSEKKGHYGIKKKGLG